MTTDKPKPREWTLEGHGDGHNVGIKASRINGTGGWDDLMLNPPVHVVEISALREAEREIERLKMQPDAYNHCRAELVKQFEIITELVAALSSTHDELVEHYNRAKCFHCNEVLNEAKQALEKLAEVLK